MDAAMAPPSKRRKLDASSSDTAYLSNDSTVTPDTLPAPSHVVESHSFQSVPEPPWPASSGTTEQQTRIFDPAAEGIEDFQVLIPRQETLLNSVDAAVNSVISSATSYISATESISISISLSASAPADVTPSIESSTSTTLLSNSSTITSSSGLSDNLSNASSVATSTIPTTSGNDTSISSIASSNSSTTGRPSFSGNSTTSALGSAASSRTTITPTGLIASASINSSAVYLATLSNGDVTTIARHDGAYTTTLSDGEVFVIPAMPTASSTSTTSSTVTTVYEVTSILVSSSAVEQSTVTSVATVGVAGAGGQEAPAYTTPVPSSTTSSSSGGGNNDNTPPAGTIAGGVVGGAAGLAVVVLIAMLFVRWYRRKGQMGSQVLSAGPTASPDGDGAPDTSHGPGMAERAGLMPAIAALPAFFRHQNRSTDGPLSSERGFTRVSGRKLPSAFSEGMSSEGMSGPTMSTRTPPLRNSGVEATGGQQTHHRDSDGFYGPAGDRRSVSPTSPESDAAMRNSGPELMTMSPGPQRQPQIHTGGPYVMSPSNSNIPTSATFDRTESPSTLRNSRFTEDM